MSAKTFDLDLHAAQTSQAIIEAVTGKPQDAENLITKALGVLQENGPYACVLFLYARSSTDAPIAKEVRYELLRMTFDLGLSLPPGTNQQELDNLKALLKKDEGRDWKNGLRYVSTGICSDLDSLLLVRQLWEQTLIYARYGAKSWKENPEAKKTREVKQ